MRADLKQHEGPDVRAGDLARARRLAWWSIGLLLTIIVVMGLAMQSSQAMRTAWVEDLLSLVPPIVFLVAAHFEGKPATRKFPFGFQRVNSLAFAIAAVALTSMGALMLWEAGHTLLSGERVTIGLVTIFGREMWAGWPMVAALIYSVIPPVILGRMKLPLARSLQDKVLHTDAMMNKADWMTGLAGLGGVIGLGYGLWWADAAAAGVIAFSILHDGVRAMRSAAAELIDGAPRALETDEVAHDAAELERALAERFPGAQVKLRETGPYIRAVVEGAGAPGEDAKPLWPETVERPWRLWEVTFRPKA